MTAQQMEQAESLIGNLAMIGAAMELPLPIPQGWNEEAGEIIRQSAIVLAEMIGGREMKNNVLLDTISELSKLTRR